MRKSIRFKEFEDGYKPHGKVVEFAAQPVVLRFPPSAYRTVDPDELQEWQKEVADRLGIKFDIGGGSGGTVSFCERGGSGAAYRCDSDIDSSPEMGATNKKVVKAEGSGRLRPWDSTPVVLNFPPAGYEMVEPAHLKEWAADLSHRFGMNFDIGGSSGGTVSFCERGGSGAAYRCDSDIS